MRKSRENQAKTTKISTFQSPILHVISTNLYTFISFINTRYLNADAHKIDI